jgi:hypothetical protein
MGLEMQTTTLTLDEDLVRHQQTWLGFVRFVKIMTTFVVLLLVGMAIFLL